MAGKSGLNLTKVDGLFDAGYGEVSPAFARALAGFGPRDVMQWATDLGQEVFVGSTGDGAVFRDAKLDNVRIVKGSSFEGADFSGASLDRANLRGTRLAGSSFASASLVAADLSECDLTGADLSRMVAREALLMKTNLTGANLASANLMQAVLQRSIVAGASFAGANLFRADLLDVVVDGATNMKDAHLTQIRFVAPRRDHAAG